jgi:phage terminase small subunit
MAYIEMGNAAAAYRQSYNCALSSRSTTHRRATELLDNGKIGARIDELQSAHRLRHVLTVDDIARQLDQDREFARGQNNASAALSATLGKARLFGFFHSNRPSGKPDSARDAVSAEAIAEKGRVIAAALAYCTNDKENKDRERQARD